MKADEAWWNALEFGTTSELDEVDKFRADTSRKYVGLAEQLLPEKEAWLKRAPGLLKKMMANVHGPFMARICADMGCEDEMFMQRMQNGFPVAGMMGHSSVGMVPDGKIKPQVLSMEELHGRRVEMNVNAVAKMKEVEHAGDLTDWPRWMP